jgi:glycine hydroxymethyltransferase
MSLANFDPALNAALEGESLRQERFIELIASENYASPRVLEAQGSCLTNKYADGYPGARTYQGCEFVDIAETLARERACALFGASYANVQPYSGTQANAAAFAALLEPGDTLLGMAAEHGGHITHGNVQSFAGRLYRAVQYGTTPSGEIDYAQVLDLARAHRPRLIVAGYSAYARVIDWSRFRDIADDVGAYLLVDMAHAAGLIAAGLYPNPVPYADVCTSTTHKTLRGPRGGLIVASDRGDLAAKLDAAVYPNIQGGPLMHVIAAKAAAFYEALQEPFRAYQRRVLENARVLGERLAALGFTLVSGGTDNHMLLVDLNRPDGDAKAVAQVLERAHIAVSSLQLPRQARTDLRQGLRIGTPAVTTRGFGEGEMRFIADAIGTLAGSAAGRDPATIEAVKAEVLALCASYPVYGAGSAWGD